MRGYRTIRRLTAVRPAARRRQDDWGGNCCLSHSHRRTRRRWNPNIQTKSYFLPSEGRRIKLRVSAKGIKVIDRDGIEAVVARIRRNGGKV